MKFIAKNNARNKVEELSLVERRPKQRRGWVEKLASTAHRIILLLRNLSKVLAPIT
jgi:hypothetical protein